MMHKEHKRKDKDGLKNQFERMHAEKDMSRYEKYAKWTIPSVCPPDNMSNKELEDTVDSTGSRAVNHLANKLVMTLFRPSQPFFRLNVEDDQLDQLASLAETDPEAAAIVKQLDSDLVKLERTALKELNYSRFRTEATNACKNLIVTGNVLVYTPKDENVQVYSIKDYVVKRDLSGNVVKIITKDSKALATFSQEIIDLLRSSDKHKYKEDDANVDIYTCVMLHDDGKYHLMQYADTIKLDSYAMWTKEELPYLALTWNRVRGEDYGRGLVEDYAGAFNALHILTRSEIDISIVAADIKWLVRPSSVLNVKELNDAPSGSYHTGEEGDLSVTNINKLNDVKIIELAIERYIRQVSQAFLLNSAVQRDAERVTAEEIRYVAQELELAHGGIYSRFAEEWQLPIAKLILSRVDSKILKIVQPEIITGLDNLSRIGDLESLRLFIEDLSMLNAIPDDMRARIDLLGYAEYCGSRRGVEYEKILKTEQQFQAEQQAEQQALMAQQQQALAMQTEANVAEEAGKMSMQEG